MNRSPLASSNRGGSVLHQCLCSLYTVCVVAAAAPVQGRTYLVHPATLQQVVSGVVVRPLLRWPWEVCAARCVAVARSTSEPSRRCSFCGSEFRRMQPDEDESFLSCCLLRLYDVCPLTLSVW
ncbi:hypothetical protein BS78_02G337800 [Paspalum vaginatum]|nr:hypothetical protein BS78_02G337800 [Paspalum vaginatum]